MRVSAFSHRETELSLTDLCHFPPGNVDAKLESFAHRWSGPNSLFTRSSQPVQGAAGAGAASLMVMSTPFIARRERLCNRCVSFQLPRLSCVSVTRTFRSGE